MPRATKRYPNSGLLHNDRLDSIIREQEARTIAEEQRARGYQVFVEAVDAMVNRWGPNSEYWPGWFPDDLGTYIKRSISETVWNAQVSAFRTTVLSMINLGVPEFFSHAFPSVERMVVRGLTNLPRERGVSWIKPVAIEAVTNQSLVKIAAWKHVHPVDIATDLEEWYNRIHLTFQRLDLFPKDPRYMKWVHTFKDISDASWYRLVYQDKKSAEFLGYLEGSLEVLQALKTGWAGYVTTRNSIPTNILRLYHPSVKEFLQMVGIANDGAYFKKEVEDVDGWSRFVASNRNSIDPAVLRSGRTSRRQETPNVQDEVAKLIEAIADKYKAFFADWGYRVGNRLASLLEDVKHSDQDDNFHLIKRYLHYLLSLEMTYLPSPEHIITTVAQLRAYYHVH